MGVPEKKEINAEAPVKEEVAAEEIVAEIDLNVIDENEMEAELDEIINNELEYGIKEQTEKRLSELAAARDAKGLAAYLNEITLETFDKDLEEISSLKMGAVSEFLNDATIRSSDGRMSKEERKFFLDVYDENAVIHNNVIIDAGKKINALEEEIKTGNIKDTELLVDNPKVVNAMAREYITLLSGSPERKKLGAATSVQGALTNAMALFVFDQEEMDFNVDGTGYQVTEKAGMGNVELLARHNWKKAYEIIQNRDDVSLKKMEEYNKYAYEISKTAKDKYNIGIGNENGQIVITSLPWDIKKIKTSSPEELQQFRDKLVEEKGALIVANDAAAPVRDWAIRTLAAMDEAHPVGEDEAKEYTDLRDAVEGLRDIDDGMVIKYCVKNLNDAVEASKKAVSALGGDKTISKFAHNIQSFAESKLPEFENLPDSIKEGNFISGYLKDKTETIRRIDKEAELRGIELKKNDELTYSPDTDKRIETVGKLLQDAKKGVLRGSKEYDNAVKSFEEMAKAYKSFREKGDKMTDTERMNAIEAYHEASNKARLDLDKYLKYRESKGPLENNRDVKTQRRIDSVKAAIITLQDTNVFMDDRYTELTRRMLLGDNKVVTAQLKAEKDEKQKEYSAQADAFRRGLENKPSYLKHLIKGVNDAMDTLSRISAGDPDSALSDAEKEEAKKAMAAITLYTTYDHSKKNDKGFAIPLTEDRFQPMVNQLASQSAFAKVASGIETKEDIRKVMANPEELRQKYTLAAVAEKQQQKKNGNIQAENKDQPRAEVKHENNRDRGMNNNN